VLIRRARNAGGRLTVIAAAVRLANIEHAGQFNTAPPAVTQAQR
jgi:hypothetical protein